MICSKCGAQIPDGAKFCINCGFDMRGQQPTQPQQAQPQQQYAQPQYQQPQPQYQQAPPQYQQPQPQYQQAPPQYQPQPQYRQAPPPPQYAPQPVYRAPQPNYGAMAARAGVGVAKKASPVKAILITLLIVAIVGGAAAAIYFFVLTPDKTPEDTLQKLEDSINDFDTDAMLECFTPEVQRMYKGMMGMMESILGEVVGFDVGGLFEFASGLGGALGGSSFMPHVEIECLDVEYSDDHCVAYVYFETTFDGRSEGEYMYLPMEKQDHEWLITLDLSEITGLLG